MRGWLVAGLALLSVPALAAAALNIDSIAGVYKARHVIEVYGEAKDHAQAEDILEIVKTAPNEAYVNAVLEFTNGHECNVSGVTKAEGVSLIWRHRDPEGSVANCG